MLDFLGLHTFRRAFLERGVIVPFFGGGGGGRGDPILARFARLTKVGKSDGHLINVSVVTIRSDSNAAWIVTFFYAIIFVFACAPFKK